MMSPSFNRRPPKTGTQGFRRLNLSVQAQQRAPPTAGTQTGVAMATQTTQSVCSNAAASF